MTMLALVLVLLQGERPGETDLTVDVDRDGTCAIQGKKYGTLGDDDTARKIGDVLIARRQMKALQEKEGKDDYVKYTLFVKLDPETPFGAAQHALISATGTGGVTRMVLLTDWTAETQVRLDMPRDKGLADDPPPEVRIVICAGGDTKAHQGERAKHFAADKKPDPCAVRIGDLDLGTLKDDNTGAIVEKTAAAALKARDKAREGLAKDAPVSVILEADREVPARHAIAFLRALKAKGLAPEIAVTVPRK